MPIVVNTNVSATTASFNLSRAKDSLRKSFAGLSSGNQIVSPADDAGGLAVAYKMPSSLKRDYPAVSTSATTEGAALWNVGGTPELQVLSKAAIQTEGNNWRIRIQDDMPGATGGLPSLGIGPDPKDTLKTLFTMNLPDNLGNYDYDFLETYAGDNFQVSLYATATLGAKLAAYLPTPDSVVQGGAPGVQDTWGDYGGSSGGLSTSYQFQGGYVPVPTSGSSGSSGPLTTTGVASTAVEHDEVFTDDGFLSSIMFVYVGQFTSVIERIADARAENGAEQSRLNMSSELLTRKQTNLEAAHGRIMDADIALESTRFARHNVLVQASAAMTAQANQLTNVVLTLLG